MQNIVHVNYQQTGKSKSTNKFGMYTSVNKNTIRTYLNDFIEKSIITRKSKKERDINALYVFKNE